MLSYQVCEIGYDLDVELRDTLNGKIAYVLILLKNHVINLESVNVAYPETRMFEETSVMGWL